MAQKNSEEMIVEIVPVIFEEIEEEIKPQDNSTELKVEVDEMQSFVVKKSNQRWLGHGINHYTGEVLAYVMGSRTDEMFLKLKKMLEPFGITKFYTDGLKTYERHIPLEKHQVSKFKMPKIERKHLTLRTRIKRLARKTICFSKSEEMHDIVIGLFINRYEFGMDV